MGNDILENGLGGDRGRVDTIVGVHHGSVYPVLFSGRVFDAVGDNLNQGGAMEVVTVVISLGFVFGCLVLWALIGHPIWNVWASRKSGEAEYQEAINEQRIQVAEAQARLDAAELNKRAAIVEAQAVAAQVKEIGEQLTKHDLYLKWQWIKMMEDREGETIYVPTEASLPILEATRRAS